MKKRLTNLPNRNYKKNLTEVESKYRGTKDWQFISPFFYGQIKLTLPCILKNVGGYFMDLGCGDLPFRNYILPLVMRYDALDLVPRNDFVTFNSDIQDMGIIADESYDSAICLEVLEHISNPFKAAVEIYRILKPGAVLVISVPHLSRLHDLPFDYFRFTEFGLRNIFEEAGFEILELKARGGLLSFLGHQVSIILHALFFSIPILNQLVFQINKYLISIPFYWLDTRISITNYFPHGYVVVAKKKLS
jgi:SAM-dependent methyltransferase